jgi:hypothetical protein
MNRGTKPAQDQPNGSQKRRIRLSNVNGMVLVVAALAATIFASGLTEARFLKQEQLAKAARSAANEQLKLAQCPRSQVGLTKSAVR